MSTAMNVNINELSAACIITMFVPLLACFEWSQPGDDSDRVPKAI